MKQWLEYLRKASWELKIFYLNVVVFLVIILGSMVWCYARLSYAPSFRVTLLHK